MSQVESTGTVTAGEPASEAVGSTRDRILDVALDLFIEQGYDGTSLREIAERLGLTKAALYYHFASKEDILMALHLRLHDMGREALRRLMEGPVTLALWGDLLDEFVEEMLAQRKIFLLHERNQAAVEKLHHKEHDADHEDLQRTFHLVLSDAGIDLRDRVRMACSFGAVFGGLFMAGNAFADVEDAELGALVRAAVHDLVDG